MGTQGRVAQATIDLNYPDFGIEGAKSLACAVRVNAVLRTPLPFGGDLGDEGERLI